MYSSRELEEAKAIIKKLARQSGVSEEEMREEIKLAMEIGRSNPDPEVKAKWAEFDYAGSEPSIEEFVLWVSELTNKSLDSSDENE